MAATFTATYAVTGSYTWKCPAGVSSASWTCNGSSTFNGGGTGSGSVTAGTGYTVVVASSASVVVTWSMTSPAVIAAATTGVWKWAAPGDLLGGTAAAECWAGGGGSGGVASGTHKAGAGGGGEYAKEPSLAVTAGSSYTLVVGAGGPGGTNAPGAGNPGTSSTVAGDSVTATANPGQGGAVTGATSAGGAAGTGSTNTTHNNGGAGGSSSSSTFGGPGGGGSGGTAAAGNAGTNASTSAGAAGATAVTGGGPGGNGGAESPQAAGSSPASGPGGGGGAPGGGGGGSAFAGAAGYDGQVKLTWSEGFAATGSAVMPRMALAGTGGQTFAATGSAALPRMALAGTGAGGNTTTSGGVALKRMALAGTGHSPVFPEILLDLAVDLDLAGTWTAVKSYVYQRDGGPIPVITRGRNPESPSPVAATLAAEFNNRDSRFSPHNPVGAYYGSIGRNTPLRVSVPGAAARLRMEDDAVSSASTPAIDVDGTLTLSIDLKLSNWTASVLASQWSATAGNFSWAFLLDADGSLQFWYTTDGSTIVTAESTQPLPWPGGRISLQVIYTESTGVVTFGYATSISGSYTQLGAAISTGTTGAVYDSTAAIAVGANTYFAGLPGYLGTYAAPAGEAWSPAAYQGLQGAVYEMRLYDGASLVADPVFSAQTDGTTSFTDAQSNTWTLNGTATISSRAFRGHFEVSEWPPRSDETGTDVWTPVTASGLLRRLQQKAAPIGSTMTRRWQRVTGTYAPLAYWPCEDGNNSQVVTLGLVSSSTSNPTQIASGLASGLPMTLTGTRKTTFASSAATDFLCTNPLPIPHTDTWTGPVAPYTQPASNPANVVRFLLDIPSGGDTSGAVLVRVLTQGSIAQMDLLYQATGALQLLGYDDDGVQQFDSGHVAFGQAGVPCLAEMAITTHSTGITWHINTLNLGATGQTGLSGNVASSSVGATTAVIVNPAGASVSSAIGQIAVQSAYADMDSATSADALIGPLNAWAGEAAGLRFARLCAEQGYASRVTGYPQTSVAMGPQSPQTFMTLLQEVESADHGVIYEPRTALALAYRCSMSLAAQADSAAGVLPLVLTYTSAHLGEGAGQPGLEPLDDDQLTVNDELVTRGSGSVTGSLFEATETAAQFAATSALSISAPPNGVGLYQDAQTVNVWLDSQLGGQAGWLVHLGTVNELRFPVVPVNLARTELAALVNSLAELDIGDYLQIASPPAWIGPDTIKALVWGYTETLGGFVWKITCQTRPESPWEVLVAGSGAASDCRADADGSTLAAGYSSSATSLSVASAAGTPVWTTAAGDLPFDIVVAGERMTVTAISGTSSPQTFSVTRSVNGVVKSQASGAAVNLFQPCYAALV